MTFLLHCHISHSYSLSQDSPVLHIFVICVLSYIDNILDTWLVFAFIKGLVGNRPLHFNSQICFLLKLLTLQFVLIYTVCAIFTSCTTGKPDLLLHFEIYSSCEFLNCKMDGHTSPALITKDSQNKRKIVAIAKGNI